MKNFAAEAPDKKLVLNRDTGRIEASSPFEGLRTRTLIAAHRLLAPFSYLGISRVFSAINRGFRPLGTTVICSAQFSFEYPSGDYYWDRLLDREWEYEPEIASFLRALEGCEFSFFDLGANFGFWSTRVSQQEFGCHPVIAIEASSACIPILRNNLSGASGSRKILHRVVDSSPKSRVNIYGKRHAGISVFSGWDGGTVPIESVETISVDGLFEEMAIFTNADKTVCKIDIEGAELNALKGAHHAAETDVVFILEETGDLASSEALAYASTVLGMRLFVLSGDTPVPIETWPSVQPSEKLLSHMQSVGVNVLGTKSKHWLSVIKNLRL